MSDKVSDTVTIDGSENCYFPYGTKWTYPIDWGSYIWTTTGTVYKYQIFCPNCGTANWAELNVIIGCYNCGASLRAIEDSQKARKIHEIPIKR